MRKKKCHSNERSVICFVYVRWIVLMNFFIIYFKLKHIFNFFLWEWERFENENIYLKGIHFYDLWRFYATLEFEFQYYLLTQPRALLGSVTNIHFIWPNMAFIMKLILWDCVRFPIFTLTILNGNPCQNYLGTFQTYSLGRNHGYTYMCWIKLKRFTYKPKKFLTMQLPFWTF